MRFAFARRAAERQRATARRPVWAGVTGAAVAAVAAVGLPFGAGALPVEVRWTLMALAVGCAGLAVWKMRRLRRGRRPAAMRETTEECPGCGHVHTERIPQDVCRIAWRCPTCGCVVPVAHTDTGGERQAL